VRISGDVEDVLTQVYKRKRYIKGCDEDAEPEDGEKRDDETTVEKDSLDTEEKEDECGWSCNGGKGVRYNYPGVTILYTDT
jgi:hypothetical protein